MKITQELRQQAEDQASEVQLRLYAEPESGEQLWAIAMKFGLIERTSYYTFTQLVGDIILGFYKTSDTLSLIQQSLPNLEPVKQLELEMEIKKFLLPLTTAVPSLQSEIAEIENAAQSLDTVRTMQKDIERVQHDTPIHQSSQDSLLQARPVTSVPPHSEPPRWGTQ